MKDAAKWTSLNSNESTHLLQSRQQPLTRDETVPSTTSNPASRWIRVSAFLFLFVVILSCSMMALHPKVAPLPTNDRSTFYKPPTGMMGISDTATTETATNIKSPPPVGHWTAPDAHKRCQWVVDLFTTRYQDVPRQYLKQQYRVQSQDFNVFYRATAKIFWLDFAGGNWANVSLASPMDAVLRGDNNHPSTTTTTTTWNEKALWTWVTGDQHLSNFGAWRNRNNETVFSVNDFDEAALYDFQIDLIRVAVSVYNHAVTNGLSHHDTKRVNLAFLHTYVDTVIGYIGDDRALVFEITPKTAQGVLRDYLRDVDRKQSTYKQLDKYTEMDPDTGNRRFITGKDTKLRPISEYLYETIRDSFTATKYGATMMKMGFKVRSWSDDFYKILDIKRRVGSGVGSYGVDRFYVLLVGDGPGEEIILDVKYEPSGAVDDVLTEKDKAWYNTLFAHPAARAVEGQRQLTSYTDPFTGWVEIDGRAFVVRQRSPWKDSPDIRSLTDIDDFVVFMEQVAISTATSHTRGSLGKSPGQFKHFLGAALGEYDRRAVWAANVERVAKHYHEQVVMDFDCFVRYVQDEFQIDAHDTKNEV